MSVKGYYVLWAMQNSEAKFSAVFIGNDRYLIKGIEKPFPVWYPSEEPGVYGDIIHRTHLPLVASRVEFESNHSSQVDSLHSSKLLSNDEWWNSLRDYQLEAIEFMRERKGSLLGDDLGLGKTRTALAAADPPALVVAPASTLRNVWAAEAEARGWNYFILEGLTVDANMLDMVRTGRDPNNRKIHIWICSYTTFAKWGPFFGHNGVGNIHTLIGDEIHYLQQKRSVASRAWRAVQAERKIGLTATPIRNRLKSLWAILDALSPKMWGSLFEFRKLYCGATEGQYGLVDGDVSQDTINRLDSRLSEVMIRRTRQEVGHLLPPLTRKTIQVPVDTSYVQEIEEEIRQKVRNRAYKGNLHTSRQLAYFTEWRKATCLLKADFVADHVMGLIPEWGRVVVWVWHKEMASQLAEIFAQEDIKTDIILGGTTSKKRVNVLEDWKVGDPYAEKVLIASIGALSTGVSLTAAGIEVFCELDYAPLQIMQAEKRTHRFGQKHDRCEAHYMVIPGTVDTTIAQVLLEKTEEIESLLGKDDQATQMRQLLGVSEPETDDDFLKRIYEMTGVHETV